MTTDAGDANGAGGGPDDVRREAARRAQEILAAGGGPPASPDGLAQLLEQLRERMRLAALLRRAGEKELADRLGDDSKALAAGSGDIAVASPASAVADAAANVIKLARRLEELGDEARARRLFDAVKGVLVNRARDILRGEESPPGDVLKLARSLDKLDEFNFAWRVLDRARAHPSFGTDEDLRTRIVQKRALYTYKDVTQPLGKRLDEALAFLEKYAGLPRPDRAAQGEGTKDQETLGLAGAIYKRKWELDKQSRYLDASLGYYKRGYEQKSSDAAGQQYWNDQGYTAINAAFILDLMAHEGAQDAEARRAEARKIREEVATLVPPMTAMPEFAWLADEWFFYSTVGEAYFGLGRFQEASDWLVARPRENAVTPPDWEFETTARQLANIARLQGADADFSQSEAWAAFKAFLGASPLGKGGDVSHEAVMWLPEGKVGLALSGGGFRASLFHIGVLARLAELDMLRRVEVISCVSGGSIVGAHYYLEVRKLLRERPDAAITRDDYVGIVRRLEERFLAGVQTNIRTSVLTDRRLARRMLRRDYSRTTRLGELYEERIYSLVEDEVGQAKGADGAVRPRYMHELVIQPVLKSGDVWRDFKPRNHNWRRRAKAPILILNAATLNTGHNWQFTATYMGEAPATIHREVDSVYRLRRKYYKEAPDSADSPQLVRLGAAVAASSCVPLLFEPVYFDGLYESGGASLSVKLVDGGVCDNQGVAGLLEQDCTVLLVSDGSGQMDALARPSSESLNVALRSNGVLQARIRGTQYRELDARLSASMLNGLLFVHLKKDLDNAPVDWAGCPPESQLAPDDARQVLTRYGVSKEVQRRLAAIRTDLDSFSDLEAYALMASAYRMTRYEYANCPGLPRASAREEAWKFLDARLERAMKGPGAGQSYLNTLLDASGSLFGKIWKLDENLRKSARRLKRLLIAVAAVGVLILLFMLAALALSAVSLLLGLGWPAAHAVLTWVGLALTLLLFFGFLLCLVALAAYFWKLRHMPEWVDAVAHTTVGGLLLWVGTPAARWHMSRYERPFIEWGKLDKLP
jgi:predicted acylesterase/phospholipase RssA